MAGRATSRRRGPTGRDPGSARSLFRDRALTSEIIGMVRRWAEETSSIRCFHLHGMQLTVFGPSNIVQLDCISQLWVEQIFSRPEKQQLNKYLDHEFRGIHLT